MKRSRPKSNRAGSSVWGWKLPAVAVLLLGLTGLLVWNSRTACLRSPISNLSLLLSMPSGTWLGEATPALKYVFEYLKTFAVLSD
jgi:hypothetical protein